VSESHPDAVQRFFLPANRLNDHPHPGFSTPAMLFLICFAIEDMDFVAKWFILVGILPGHSKLGSRQRNSNHAISAMSTTQLFLCEAALGDETISSTIECENINEALLLVNQLYAEAESVTVSKIKQRNVRLRPI
jgi:hypothetical protein